LSFQGKKHMNDTHVVEHLLAYVNGNLDESARRAVDEHIAACVSCRRERDALKEFWERLGDIPQERPASRLASGFQATLGAYAEGIRHRDHDAMPGRGLRGRIRAFRPTLRVAFAGSLVAAGLACGYLLGGGNAGEVAELRGEVRALSNLLTVSLLHQESASERLKGVSLGSRMEGMDRISARRSFRR
jgi:anti-sigma factor RsiW